MIRIREAAVAGSFYPADAAELRETVQRLLDAAAVARGPVSAAPGPVPAALVVPHAGYVYSGPVAAAAYARLRPHRQRYRRVLLLGPCHRVPFAGMAVSDADAFRTPLGDVPLDRPLIESLIESLNGTPGHPAVMRFDVAHRSEHSLEVQLPFLQVALDAFTLVPIVVGDASPKAVAAVIDRLWRGPETLLIVSSDLSHYLGYAQARRRDRGTCMAIEALDGSGIAHSEACGATPLRGLLIAAAQRGLRAVTLDLRNSGDTAGGPDDSMRQVVGYGAWMFVEGGSCAVAA
jgi:AmmeMemoRadiSam system protein B